MKRLWDQGAPLDEVIHRFTVGEDPRLDLELVHWDCLGSAAHVRTLERAGLLTGQEAAALVGALAQIDALHAAGRFLIPPELEDCHTAIEAHLTQCLGPLGEKIHAGRSRNDQVATAMRLYMRDATLGWLEGLGLFGQALLERIARDGPTPMPGYTHMQPAMPSSVGQWLHAWLEGAVEQMRAGLDLLERLDACPLGTGAGFGVPLPLDRQYAASLLGFTRVQRSPIDVQNSRGRLERYFVRVGTDIAGLLEKLACDLLIFSSAEYGFFSLPESMTTGSSIMPQKRNPDVLELIRARAGQLRGCLAELEFVAAKLPSGYHRDLQLTKEPAIRAARRVTELLGVAPRVVELLVIHADRLRAAMRPELYATQAACELVRQGVPFRQAYRRVAEQIRAGVFSVPDTGPSSGAPDDSAITAAREELIELRKRVAAALQRALAPEGLLGVQAASAPP